MAADALHRRTGIDARALPAGLALLTIVLQICYPLVHGVLRDRLTVAVVLAFAAASLSHAAVTRGLPVGTAVLVVTAGLGLGVEALGVRTGFPFGHYAYASTLGMRVAGVPVVIVVAWTMFSWPAALVARRLVGGFTARVMVGAWAFAAWDLFLDPQMVAAGHWRWTSPTPHLPGVDAVPLSNYAGWLGASLMISLVLQVILSAAPTADDCWPIALYLWTYLSSVLALPALLDLTAAAAWGALGMGLVAVPLGWSLWRVR